MKINGIVGESMTLNVTHDTNDEGASTVVVHCPQFSAVGVGIDIFDALLSLAQEIIDIRPHYVDEPDEKLAPDALRLKRRLVEWFSRAPAPVIDPDEPMWKRHRRLGCNDLNCDCRGEGIK